jgi:gliding motility-associated-like protein
MKTYLLTFLLLSVFASYELMAQCPPPGFPATGDTCPLAPVLCTNLDGYCDTLGNINVVQNFPGCPSNVLNNDEWFGFVAGTTTIALLITPSDCQGTPGGQFGVQGAILEGGCSGSAIATQCGCTTNPFTLTASNFIVGQTYYVVFDGCAGDICAFTVNVTQGSTIPSPPATPAFITGPTQVCPGSVAQYTVPNPDDATYTWSLNGVPPNVGTILGPNPNGDITVAWNSEGTATICVLASNGCFNNPVPACITVTSQNIPQTDEYYDLCIGDCLTCAGQTLCAPGEYPVALLNYLGCDSVVVCHITGIPFIQTDNGQITMCGPATYEVCGTNYSSSGIYTTTCTNWQGCDSTVLADVAIFDPQANILPPASLDCSPGSTVILNGVNSTFALVPGGQTLFLWAGPGIVGPNDDILVDVDQPGQYCLTVSHERNNVSCSDTKCVTVTQDNAVPQIPQFTGDFNPCQGDTTLYDAMPVGLPSPSGYTWYTPNGETIIPVDSNSVEVVWADTTGGQLCVTADNGCGSSDSACVLIVVTPGPEPPFLVGPDSVCTDNTLQTYFITNPSPGVTYNWTVPPGASFSGSSDTITVNFSGTTPGLTQVCATVQNLCGSFLQCIDIVITAVPLLPVMAGPDTVCTSGTYNFDVTNPQAGVTYNWTAPSGATINGTGTNVTIEFLGASTGQVCVSATNICGTSNQACQTVVVIPAPSGTISGSGEFCVGSGDSVNLTITLTGTGPWDVEYALDGGTPIPLVISNSPYPLVVYQAGTYTLVSVITAASSCPGAVLGSAVVTENPLPTADLSGSGSICQGSGQTVPLTIDLTGEAPWTVEWTVNGNAQAALNINATPDTLNIGQAQSGNIALTGVTDNNGCVGTVSGTSTVVVNTAPTVSNIQSTCDPTNTLYVLTFNINGGDPSSYTVTPPTGTLTGNLFTSDPIASGSGYVFVVSDANDCNPLTMADTVLCDCTSAVGIMDGNPVSECGDGPVTVPYDNSTQVFDGNDTLAFVFHSGSGVSIVPPILSTTSTPTVSFDPATMTYGTTYYLSAVVGDDGGSGFVDLNDPCLAVAQGTPITFFEIPTATLSGAPAVCVGSPAQFSVSFTGESPWSISYDDGSGNIQTINGITNNPYTLTKSPVSSTTYCLTAMGDVNCTGTVTGCGTATIFTGVQYDSLEVVCNPTSTAFTVSFIITGGDPATYIVTGATGTITGGPPYVFTSDPIPTGSGYDITIDDVNSCDPKNVSQTQVICNCVSDAGTMSTTLIEECGDGPVNVGDAVGTALDPDDVLLYYLHTNNGPSLGTVIAISPTPSFAFDPATMTYGTTYYVSAVIGSDDGTGAIDLTDPCLSITPGTPLVFYEIPTATLSGSTEVCPGVPASLVVTLTGDSPWSVTINGQVITGIVNTPYNYIVSPSGTTVYDLTEVSDQNCTAPATGSETITLAESPTVQNLDIQCNSTGTGYTVCFDIVGGDPACYQVAPNNGTLTAGQFCSNEIPDGQGYLFNVSDCHGCPPVVVDTTLIDCACLSVAGDMDATPVDVCGTALAQPVYLGGEFLDGDDVLCYMLHNGDNVPIATNTAGEFAFNPSSMNYEQQYYICAVVGNDDGSGCVNFADPCLNTGGCAPVTFHAIPTAVLSGDASICNGGNTNLSVTLTGAGPWNLTYQDAGGNPVDVVANSSPHLINVAPAGSDVFSLVSLSDANCTGTVSGNALINVNNPPQIVNVSEICDIATFTYEVTFEIIGGDAATYNVTPATGTITTGIFMSDPIPSAQTYTFQVDDVNGCGPTEVSGVQICECGTDAGNMPAAPLSFCENVTAIVSPATGTNLDPEDVLIYVLHTSSTDVLGTILAISNTPNFNFIPGVTVPGTTYYISAVAGNDDGSGNVDLNDNCLSVAPGTPVVFNALPTITLTGTTTVCEGENAAVSFNMTGTGPFTVTYLVNGSPQPTLPGLPASFSIEQVWDVSSTLTVTSVTDMGTGCLNTFNESVTITVNQQPVAGTAIGNFSICQNAGDVLDLNSQVTGADPGGQWTGPGGVIVPNGILNTNGLPPGNLTYTYTLTGLPPCTDDAVSLQVLVDPQPTADAGPNQELNCDIDIVTIGGSNTSPGFITLWTGGPVSDSTATNPTTTTPGVYTITVTTPSNGCTDSDVVTVFENITVPEPHITISDVSCFGRTDGYILIDSITNGEPPYLCSFDGSAFSAVKQFTNLLPGEHSLIIQDAAGCQTIVNFQIGEPGEVTVEIEGSFEGNDPIVNLGGSVTLEIITNPPFGFLDTVVWMPDTLVDCGNCQQNDVTLNQQTTFSVMISEDGCEASDQLTVFVTKDHPVYVPNAFSPNEDGRNDIFMIYGGSSIVRIKSFLVFNRWGETVHEYYNFPPNYALAGWTGYFRGQRMDPGVFTWFAEVEFIDGLVELLEGDVTLIR